MEQEEDSGNSLGLKIMFGLLFIIFIGEIMYFFILPTKKPFLPATPIIPTLVPLTPTPSPTKMPTSTKPSPLTQELQGKIIEINTTSTNPALVIYKIELSLKLEINNNGQNKRIVFYFDKDDLINMKVTDVIKSNISYKDLRIDQNIKLVKTYDFKKSPYSNIEVNIVN